MAGLTHLQERTTPEGHDRPEARDDVPSLQSKSSSSTLVDSRSNSPLSRHTSNGAFRFDQKPDSSQPKSNSIVQVAPVALTPVASQNIHWQSPALMAGFFVAGVCLALGHHLHYQNLEGQVVGSATTQQWAIRFGTVFAFLSKACLTAAVGIAFTQRLWVTVKKEPISLRNLDNVFSLTTDPASFFSFEVLSSAKILCILAACMWCIPIVATITPATLSVRSGTLSNSTMALAPFPVFHNLDHWANSAGAGLPSTATAAVNRILAATSSSMSILPFAAPFPNSSYTINFYGPAMKCDNLSTASADGIDLGDAKSLQDAFNQTLAPSYWDMSYYFADSTETLKTTHLFVYVQDSPAQKYSCHLWNASYEVLFQFNDGVQSTRIKNLTYISPTNYQRLLMSEYASGTLSYWSMFDAMNEVLSSRFGVGSTDDFYFTDSTILQTGVAACPPLLDYKYYMGPYYSSWMCRNGSVDKAIEDLSHNFTLSLLSSDMFSTKSDVNVTVVSNANYYEYNRTNLLLAYAVAIVVALASTGVGVAAYFVNGYSASTSFSSIIATTRNPDLDQMARGACLGSQPLPKGLGGAKLRYGILKTDDDTLHAAFGLEESTTRLRREDICS
ncbi:hypothetical protein IWZ01DRAFT_332530 [Phyllosticta capitalensis]